MSFRLGLPFVCLFFALSLFHGVKSPLMLVLAVLIHEGGHILAARLMKAPVTALSLGIHGFSLSFDFTTVSYIKEFFIIISGSAVGLLAAFAAYKVSPRLSYFTLVSAVMALINLLPIRGLDGGEALFCLLAHFMLPDRACAFLKVVSLITAGLFWMGAVWIQLRVHPNLSILAASFYFLWQSTKEH